VNFNPDGAAYDGLTDTDTGDQYPSEIQGLVHVTDELTINRAGRIRGALICESDAGGATLDMDSSDFQVIYDKALLTTPPPYYTSSVPMRVQPGSIEQVVE
jgi:hypothetical protein